MSAHAAKDVSLIERLLFALTRGVAVILALGAKEQLYPGYWALSFC